MSHEAEVLFTFGAICVGYLSLFFLYGKAIEKK